MLTIIIRNFIIIAPHNFNSIHRSLSFLISASKYYFVLLKSKMAYHLFSTNNMRNTHINFYYYNDLKLYRNIIVISQIKIMSGRNRNSQLSLCSDIIMFP